jgi:dTDP-4-dehydrorhamnose reductase
MQVWGGIECTINRIGNDFLDQLDYVDYYTKSYIDEFVDLKITKLRFPICGKNHQPSLKQRSLGVDRTAIRSVKEK